MARSLRVLSQPLADIKDFACLDDKAAIIQALKEVHFIRPEQSNSINKARSIVTYAIILRCANKSDYRKNC